MVSCAQLCNCSMYIHCTVHCTVQYILKILIFNCLTIFRTVTTDSVSELTEKHQNKLTKKQNIKENWSKLEFFSSIMFSFPTKTATTSKYGRVFFLHQGGNSPKLECDRSRSRGKFTRPRFYNFCVQYSTAVILFSLFGPFLSSFLSPSISLKGFRLIQTESKLASMR